MAPKLNPQESGQRILASPCHLSFPTDFSPKDTGNLSHCSASYQLTTTKHFKKALEEEMGEREKKKANLGDNEECNVHVHTHNTG